MSVLRWWRGGGLERAWRSPHCVTYFAKLHASQVEAAIAHIRAARSHLGLDRIDGLHFFRILVVPPEPDLRGRLWPGHWIMSAVYEGDLAGFTSRLVQTGGEPLLRILRFCEGFQPDARALETTRWLLGRAQFPQNLHVGTLWDELSFVRDEHRLQVAIANHLDRRSTSLPSVADDALVIRRDIQEFVRQNPDLPQKPRPRRSLIGRLAELLDTLQTITILALAPTVLAGLVAWRFDPKGWPFLLLIPAMALGLVAAYLLVVRGYEIIEGDRVVPTEMARVESLVADEDFGIQNQFTMLTPIRDSFFRRLNLRFVLWLANAVSKHWYHAGKLVGIDTIHFARFHVMDEGRRMLFMSDFDGGWERYLFDFLGVGSFAVVPIWTNLHGCPKTWFLRFPTLGFAQRFLPFTRANQRKTHLWYSAVDHLTVSEIKRNARIRAGLFGGMSRRAAVKWLKLL